MKIINYGPDFGQSIRCNGMVLLLLKCHAFHICLNLSLDIVFANNGVSVHGYVVQYSSLQSFLTCPMKIISLKNFFILDIVLAFHRFFRYLELNYILVIIPIRFLYKICEYLQ